MRHSNTVGFVGPRPEKFNIVMTMDARTSATFPFLTGNILLGQFGPKKIKTVSLS